MFKIDNSKSGPKGPRKNVYVPKNSRKETEFGLISDPWVVSVVQVNLLFEGQIVFL